MTQSFAHAQDVAQPTPRLSFLASRYLIPIVLLLLMFGQIVGSTTRTSLTIDEGLHMTSGYSILRTGDYRLIEEHPPLVKFITAWPLLLVPDLADPRDLTGWELDVDITDSLRLVRVTQELVYDYQSFASAQDVAQPLDRLVFAARLPIALLALLLGAVAFHWAADWFGPRGGLLALFLLAFDPNIIAHAGLAATDLGAACFILIAMFAFQRFLRRPSWGRWALAGLTLGLAQGAKLSAVLLLPTQGLLILVYGIWNTSNVRVPFGSVLATADRGHKSRCRVMLRWGTAYTGMLALAALVLWALYGFKAGPVPELGLSLPAASHAIPWMRLREHMQEGHAAFLMGQVSHQGWWYYFPVALALKTPLPVLLAWLSSLVALLLGLRRRWQEDLALLLFPILYLALSLQSSLNIGYRHLLPILPFLAIFAGRLAACLQDWPGLCNVPIIREGRILVAGLGLWLMAGTLSLHPHHLAYFNELAGGPDGGYRYLVDSNTDWGQALKELAHYQDQHDIESVHLSMFTFLDPALYGVRYQPLTPMHGDTPAVFPSRFNPPPGVYVISTTTLQGIPLADPEMFDWFRHREPDARIAHVMFLYDVLEEAESGEWVAQCLTPVVPLTPEAIAEGFGHQDLRRAYFDCTQSWLFPSGGQSPGWCVLYRDLARSDDSFIQAHLASTRLSFEQTRRTTLPPFAIYEASSSPVSPEHPTAMPVQVGDLTFLGHTVWKQPDSGANGTIEVWTFWRVDGLPNRPLSLMLHLVGSGDAPSNGRPAGAPVVVGDGLGVPLENWQVGDVIVQRHHLEVPQGAPGGDYALYTGAYWLDTLERWPIVVGRQTVGDQFLLSTLSLE